MSSTGSFSSSNRAPLFQVSVDKLFNNWEALQIAVENGQGGSFGKDIAIWMRKAVEDFFYENDDLMGVEVAEFLGTIMDQELDTVVDDNSLDELGNQLCQHFRMAMGKRDADIVELHKSLDAAASAAASKPRPIAQNGTQDSDDDESSDEEMETDEAPTNSNGTRNNDDASSAGPSSHRTGHNFVTEPDDEGWVTVIKPKKH